MGEKELDAYLAHWVYLGFVKRMLGARASGRRSAPGITNPGWTRHIPDARQFTNPML